MPRMTSLTLRIFLEKKSGQKDRKRDIYPRKRTKPTTREPSTGAKEASPISIGAYGSHSLEDLRLCINVHNIKPSRTQNATEIASHINVVHKRSQLSQLVLQSISLQSAHCIFSGAREVSQQTTSLKICTPCIWHGFCRFKLHSFLWNYEECTND